MGHYELLYLGTGGMLLIIVILAGVGIANFLKKK